MPIKALLMAFTVAVIWGVNMLTVKGAVGEQRKEPVGLGEGRDARVEERVA